MVLYVYTRGGLGNVVAQFAAAYSLGKEFGHKVVLVCPEYNAHNITARQPATQYEMFRGIESVPALPAELKVERLSAQEAGTWVEYKLERDNDKHYYLEGDFQNHKYWAAHLAEIRDLLFSNFSATEAVKINYQQFANGKPTVMLHVRRGDYLRPSIARVHPTCTDAYYRQAIACLPDGIRYRFLIFTDDPDYVTQEWPLFRELDAVCVEPLDSEPALVMMSMCDHFILANSSLSQMAYEFHQSSGGAAADSSVVVVPTPWMIGHAHPAERFSIVDRKRVSFVDSTGARDQSAVAQGGVQTLSPRRHLDKYKGRNRILVETGSYEGDGIADGLTCGYERVISFEVADKYHSMCTARYRDKSNIVKVVHGSSAKLLGAVLAELVDEPATFWLDGHYSAGQTGFDADHVCPLLQEIAQIGKHRKDHTILVDDLRLCRPTVSAGMDGMFDVSVETLIAKLREINPDYVFAVEDGYVRNDVLAAYVPSHKQEAVEARDLPIFSVSADHHLHQQAALAEEKKTPASAKVVSSTAATNSALSWKLKLAQVPFYVINLPSAEKRLKHVLGEFARVGLPAPTVIRAVVDHRGYSGCNRSHALAHAIAKRDGHSIYAVMEDDITFTCKDGELRTMELEIPLGADMVYIGISSWGVDPYQSQVSGCFVGNTVYPKPAVPNMVRMARMTSMHGVLFLNERMGDEMINIINDATKYRIVLDLFTAAMQQHFQTYAMADPLCYQDAAMGGQQEPTKIKLKVEGDSTATGLSTGAAVTNIFQHSYSDWDRTTMDIASAAEFVAFPWKQLPHVVHILEHVSVPHATRYLERISTEFKIDDAQIQRFCDLNDAVGGALRTDFGTIRASPCAIRHLFHALKIATTVSNLDSVIEIGAGYGAMALLFPAVAAWAGKPIKSYRIYDLPGPALLQKRYLAEKNTHVRYIWADSASLGADFVGQSASLLMSMYCVSEIADELRDTYLKNLVPTADALFFAWNSPSRSKYLPLIRDEVREDPLTGAHNVVISYPCAK